MNLFFLYPAKMNETMIYMPGSKWLYLKVYTGRKTADRILRDALYPCWEELRNSNEARQWFFIRFSDPELHLRFRIKLNGNGSAEGILSRLNALLRPFVSGRLLWKVETATYQPETKRYGAKSMALAEELFFYDSEACLRCLRGNLWEQNENYRWMYALASIDLLLFDFGLELADRKELLLHLNRSFGKEFGKDRALARQISDKFRLHRNQMGMVLGDENTAYPFLAPLQERSENNRPLVASLREMHMNAQLEVPVTSFISSLVHMSMNRIFTANQRLHEMVIYDLLFRYYKSLQHRC